MNFPGKVFLYQDGNRDDVPWRVALTTDNIPAGTVVGVYNMKKKIIIRIVVTEEDVIEEPPI
jgi:hypothetical protein